MSDANAIYEQQEAIKGLLESGLNLTEVARAAGVSPASVRAWRAGKKVAAGRARARLLRAAAAPDDQFRKTKTGSRANPRGRNSARERAARAAALKAEGLWPPEEFAKRLRLVLELARLRHANAGDVAAFLRVSRRTLYCYLAAGNARLPPAETVARLRLLSGALGVEDGVSGGGLELISLEERFARASLIVFGLHHYVGFLPRDPLKEQVLRRLAEDTGFNARTIRRYLPIRDKNRRLTRAVVEAFEEVARRTGRVV